MHGSILSTHTTRQGARGVIAAMSLPHLVNTVHALVERVYGPWVQAKRINAGASSFVKRLADRVGLVTTDTIDEAVEALAHHLTPYLATIALRIGLGEDLDTESADKFAQDCDKVAEMLDLYGLEALSPTTAGPLALPALDADFIY